jgi:hypothetical protein
MIIGSGSGQSGERSRRLRFQRKFFEEEEEGLESGYRKNKICKIIKINFFYNAN